MFHGVAVDGSTSCISGHSQYDEGEDGDGFQNSTLSTSSRKRGSNTTDIATSPAKKSKSPMFNIMQGLITELQTARNEEQKTLAEITSNKRSQEKQEMKEEIARCLRMAVECGATKDRGILHCY